MAAGRTSTLSIRAVGAALGLVAKGGIDSLTMRAVARSLGVTHRAVAKQTGGLPGLLALCAAEIYRQLDGFVADSPSCAPRRPGAFRAMGGAFIRFARVHPRWTRLLTVPAVTASDHPELVRARRLFYDRMVLAVEDGQRRGVLRDGPVAPIATFAWTAVQGFTLLEPTVEEVTGGTEHERAEAFLDGVFLGIRALGDPGWWPDSVDPPA